MGISKERGFKRQDNFTAYQQTKCQDQVSLSPIDMQTKDLSFPINLTFASYSKEMFVLEKMLLCQSRKYHAYYIYFPERIHSEKW